MSSKALGLLVQATSDSWQCELSVYLPVRAGEEILLPLLNSEKGFEQKL